MLDVAQTYNIHITYFYTRKDRQLLVGVLVGQILLVALLSYKLLIVINNLVYHIIKQNKTVAKLAFSSNI